MQCLQGSEMQIRVDLSERCQTVPSIHDVELPSKICG